MNIKFCQDFSRYLARQRDHLRRAIDENKWYLSERAGFDVGLETAKQDFLDRHLDKVSQDFRVTYCGKVCDGRDCCNLSSDAPRIPSVSSRTRGAG